MKRIGFNVQEAIVFAWQHLWALNLKRRADGNDFRGNTYYLTAADVEAQVRTLAYESMNGEKWGSSGDGRYATYTGDIRISVGGGGLNNVVRHWLLTNRNITHHNFARGHISGARFRPVGEPLAPKEQATLEKQAKERKRREEKRAAGEPLYITHYREEGKYEAMCVLVQRENKKAKLAAKGIRWYGPMRQPRHRAFATSDAAAVTCPRCKKLMVAHVGA